MKSEAKNQAIHGLPASKEVKFGLVDLSPSQSSSQARKVATGNVLSLHDAEMQLINSGPRGMERLALARALDMRELVPSLSDHDARMIGAGYVMLRMQGMNGALIKTTRAEVARLEAAQRVLSDES